MSANEPTDAKPGKSFDSAYNFSAAIAIGLILFIAGLVISLVLGGGSIFGLIFGVPLLIAGFVVPLIMMRSIFQRNEVSGPCPYCSAPITTSDATIRLECPTCQGKIAVSEGKFNAMETSE
jgi:hypothetical protein